jgi:DNA/RNA endonuclease G (NUC1)
MCSILHKNIILVNNNFFIHYSKKLGRQLFICYDISFNQIKSAQHYRKNYKRDIRLDNNNIYQLDPQSKIFTNNWTRGHLCPSFLMSHDKSTYLMSNIIPQHVQFNTNIWKKLELDTYNIIKEYNKPTRIIVGAFNYNYNKLFTQYDTNDNSTDNIWIDKDKNFKYIIPNIIYQIVIIDTKKICHIGLNSNIPKVYPIPYGILVNLLSNIK